MPFQVSSAQIVLGLIAGGTIFLGLPVAVVPQIRAKTSAFLNAVSTGILVYLLCEIVSECTHEGVKELLAQAGANPALRNEGLYYAAVFIVGLSIGLLGLVWFEHMYIRNGKDVEQPPKKTAERVAMMIAIGIGLHNLSEGLAIGQQFSWGESHLAVFLAIGFALHNATEGFGIAAPLAGYSPSWGYLTLLGLIGGLPTLIGAVIGGAFQSRTASILFLALAAGSILYVIGELLHLGRKLKGEALAAVGLLIGFTVAFATSILLSLAGGPS